MTDLPSLPPLRTPAELEAQLGEDLRTRRLQANLSQATLAERAGISVRALRNLEGGAGATIHTMICVLRALGREDWLHTIAPRATINPLTMPRDTTRRQRASKRPPKRASELG